MNVSISKFILPSLFVLAVSMQATAQSRRDTDSKKPTTVTKRTVTTNINRGVATTKRVPRSTVTYKKASRKVVAVRNVPNKRVVNHSGQNYYYANNTYYTQSRGRYIVIAPKVGFRVKVLPTNYRRVHFNNNNYYNVNGIFYTQTNNEYEVVDPEIGTVVYELPEDYEKVTLDGQTYYEYANILYEKIQIEGTRAYEVVGIIEMN